MIRGILGKEFYQHRVLLLLLPFLIPSGWFVYLGMRELALLGGSQFYTLSWFLWFVFPLFSLMLANAVVADEFRQRTQVFLEGLPVPRFVFLLVKYLLGAVVASLTACLLLGVTLMINWFIEGISPRFAFLLLIKTLLWAWFCWSFFFAFAFLGRYRFPIGFALLFTLLFLENQLEIQVSRFGPFDLIGEQYAYERFEIPVVAIGYTFALIALSTIVGFVFGLARDATMANMLAEKMSFREKLVMATLIFFLIFVIGSVVDRYQATEPLYLPGSIDLDYARGLVSAAAAVADPKDEERDALERHAKTTSEVLDALGEYLDIQSFPKLYLVHRRDFGPGRYEVGDLDTRQGVLIRFNAIKSTPDDEKWLRMVIRSVLLAHQHGRLDSDTRDWVVTGFSVWWPARNDLARIKNEIATENERGEPSARDLTATDLVRWRAYKKEVGESRAQLDAARILISMSEQTNPEAMRTFLSSVLGYRAPYDARATIHDYWYPVDSVLNDSTQLTLSNLIVPARDSVQKAGEGGDR